MSPKHVPGPMEPTTSGDKPRPKRTYKRKNEDKDEKESKIRKALQVPGEV